MPYGAQVGADALCNVSVLQTLQGACRNVVRLRLMLEQFGHYLAPCNNVDETNRWNTNKTLGEPGGKRMGFVDHNHRCTDKTRLQGCGARCDNGEVSRAERCRALPTEDFDGRWD